MSQPDDSPRTKDLLPWYANQSLPLDEREAVEAWLRDHPQATELTAWQQIRSSVVAQRQAVPSPAVRRQLLATIAALRQSRGARIRRAWLIGTALAALVLMGLWAIVQPGIAVEWSISGEGATTFRVYRAIDGNREFDLLNEVPARPDQRDYFLTDTSPLPGQTYTYLIEVVSPDGQSIVSRTVMGNGTDALPGQLIVLLTSLVAGYGAMFLALNRLTLNVARRPARI